jgi:hypothetical protein
LPGARGFNGCASLAFPALRIIGDDFTLVRRIINLKPRAAFRANPLAADEILVRPHKTENNQQTAPSLQSF